VGLRASGLENELGQFEHPSEEEFVVIGGKGDTGGIANSQ
jgi:hypothetical protein